MKFFTAGSAILLGAVLAHAQTYYWNPNASLLSSGAGEAQKSYNWTVNQNGSGDRPKSSFDDDFTTTTLGSAWTVLDSVKDGKSNLNPAATAGQLTLIGRGADVWSTANQFNSVYRSDITGNFDVTVRVNSQTDTDPWAHAGIMVYNDFKNAGLGGAFTVCVTPGNGFAVHYDSSGDGRFDAPTGGVASAAYPCWLRAVRSGSTFSGYYKTDINQSWTLIKTAVTAQATAANSQIGLYICSHNTTPTGIGTAVFDNFRGGGDITGTGFDFAFTGSTGAANAPANLTGSLAVRNFDLSSYQGAFSFLSNTLTASGNVNFGTLATLNAGTGTLALNATSGTQTLTLKAGTASPILSKSGAGTVQIAGGSLATGSVSISGGVLDLGSRTHDIGGFTATGGALTGLRAVDSLIVDGDADFSGLTSLPASGTMVVRSQGDGKQVRFTPAIGSFANLSLWAAPTGATPPRLTVAAGTVAVKGTLSLVDQQVTGLANGVLDFRTYGPGVAVDGDIVRTNAASGASGSLSLLMGNGTWAAKGNVALSLANGGSADASILDLKAAGPAIQTLSVTGGALASVAHSGTGTFSLGGPLSAASLTQSAGALNFNGNGVSLSGNLQVTNGTASTVSGLAGAVLTVGGTTSFVGAAGNLLNLNPNPGWTIHSTGALTADYATIANSTASGAPGNATLNCANGGNNTQWNFATPTNPPLIVKQPADTSVLAGQKAIFSMRASGSGALAFAWRKQGLPDTLGTDSVFTLNAAALSDNGAVYYCVVTNAFGKDSTRGAKLTVNDAVAITAEPADTTVMAGRKAVFSVSAHGTGALSYSWMRKGNATPIAHDSVLTIALPALSDDGAQFFCVVSNAFSADTSRSALLTVHSPAVVTREPSDTAVLAGSKARFSVTAIGTGTLAYAWRRLGDTALLASDSVYVRDSAAFADSGAQFLCVISNAFGKDTTRPAVLSVARPARIVREPKDLTVGPGRRANFSAAASGSGAVSFQWFRKGSATVLSTDSAYSLDTTKSADDGAVFYAIVSNAFGKDTSREAKLSVAVCDSFFQVARDTFTVDEGQPVTLSGKATCSDGFSWSAVSGPAPRILDPEVQDLNLIAPRVAGDSQLVYRFTAQFGATASSKDVTVKVREAIPDPKFALSPIPPKWNGMAPLVVHATLSNAAALAAAAYHPPLIYVWTLSEPLADTAQKGDSLTLTDPTTGGLLEIGLCLGNGGVTTCVRTTVELNPFAVGIFRAGAFNLGPVSLMGRTLLWNASGSVRIWDWSGRLLWQGSGHAGDMSTLSENAERSLRGHRARLEIRR